ncbi:ADP-ribose pyrophosphatase [uncultured archaeon]|nr:ADP-ribose pyrophosphatase [uncultured archaeon]
MVKRNRQAKSSRPSYQVEWLVEMPRLNIPGKRFMESNMRTPLLAVDAVILFQKGIVLIRRDNPPYEGCYALPGGFVEVGETVEDAVHREAKEETGLMIELQGLVGVYSDPGRDPRGHVVSLAYLALGRGTLVSGSDARAAEIVSLHCLPSLAFDHELIIRDALSMARAANLFERTGEQSI